MEDRCKRNKHEKEKKTRVTQFHSIQQLSFEEACVLYRLSENDNFLSERIWEIYEQYYL